jgi:hypothetical protein
MLGIHYIRAFFVFAICPLIKLIVINLLSHLQYAACLSRTAKIHHITPIPKALPWLTINKTLIEYHLSHSLIAKINFIKAAFSHSHVPHYSTRSLSLITLSQPFFCNFWFDHVKLIILSPCACLIELSSISPASCRLALNASPTSGSCISDL